MAPLSPEITSQLFIVCLVFLRYGSPASGYPYYSICNTTSNYTANSNYESNLKLLLTSLSSTASVSGFARETMGGIPDQVYGLVSCRGDSNATTCAACVHMAEQAALQSCPYNKGAIICYDRCLLRYSKHYIVASDFHSELVYFPSPTTNLQAPYWFNIVLVLGLMSSLSNLAVNSSRRFATGELNFSSGPTIYGLAQCIRDLPNDQCRQCLQVGIESIKTFHGKLGGRVLGVSCALWYEAYPFYDGVATAVLPPALNGSGTSTPPTRERVISWPSRSWFDN